MINASIINVHYIKMSGFQMSVKRNLLIGIVTVGCGVTSSSYGATATSTFQVQAIVVGACTIAANTLNFGEYDATATTDLDATTTLSVVCTSETPYTVALDKGQGPGASVANRIMTNGDDLLNYSLYQDSTRAAVWGDTIGTNTVAGNGNGEEQNLTVYGRIFSGQTTAPAGAYADTIEATIEY